MADGDPAPRTAERLAARLLHLLATEAPPAAFDLLAAEVEACPPGPARDEMFLALGSAGRVRDLLAHRRRREKAALALVESARDLAAMRDVDQVLDAMVRRARQLLGTDATYLALRDPERGDVYMRITLGTLTKAIESIRQPVGTGIGGRVVATGVPFATADYLADARLSRDPHVTDAVIEDGIVSIAGAPLRLGDEVIGVLFVANRYERAFDDAEMDLLCSLADHASIVIGNAELFERAERTAAELRAVNEELAERQRALERASAAHEQMMPLALRRADLGELVESVASMLGGTVAAVGVDGGLLVTSGDGDLPSPLPAPPHDAHAAQPGGTPTCWTVPVRAGDETFGHLVLVTDEVPSDADVRTFERAAQTAALMLLIEQQVGAAEHQVRGELIDDLLAAREPDWAALTRRARSSGALDLRVAHTVVVAAATGVTRARLLRAANEYVGVRGGLGTEHDGRVVMVLPRQDPDAVARSVASELERLAGGVVTAGVAGPADSAAEIRARHREAQRCLRLLVALGRHGQGACPTDLGMLGVILDGTTQQQVRALLGRTVDPVRRYDDTHHALLLDTLDAWFAAGQNPRAAARTLQVHPNTVYQRLDRIDLVLGHRRWREGEGAVTMQLGLQLHRLTAEIPLEELVPATGT
ncbi:transcriptional regulator, CdaR [Pseudonocardia dioxanivorans CB1190]|uniref:Transcriptional regulator, CdaR n=1 Tax=Pseudonocardia dioxanivorans (strain ATCC 55486 / DSM 44775 / JCM 13855 / CB1190) TaxID=675635 RepID=F4CT77_PSEUX|nr:GAF domain-containing protein [Pseudonocardia dioxanivorans]AEA26295.1 transcriptional regulator, CdaR [Pseudonocardia dioxanivorans CB1190]